jgi:hypothetical protein
MARTYLFVDVDVASLQFDATTTGTIILDGSVGKQMATNRLPDGKLRVIIYGLDVNTFSGKFATVNAFVLAISGVVAASPTGTLVNASIKTLSSPRGMTIQVIP